METLSPPAMSSTAGAIVLPTDIEMKAAEIDAKLDQRITATRSRLSIIQGQIKEVGQRIARAKTEQEKVDPKVELRHLLQQKKLYTQHLERQFTLKTQHNARTLAVQQSIFQNQLAKDSKALLAEAAETLPKDDKTLDKQIDEITDVEERLRDFSDSIDTMNQSSALGTQMPDVSEEELESEMEMLQSSTSPPEVVKTAQVELGLEPSVTNPTRAKKHKRVQEKPAPHVLESDELVAS